MASSAPAPWRGSAQGSARIRLRAPGARRWYGGASFGLIYQGFELWAVWASDTSFGLKLGATAALLAVYVVFLAIPPLVWPAQPWVRVAAALGFWALSCVLFPLVGVTAIWVWALLVVLVAFVWLPRSISGGLILVVVLTQVALNLSLGWPDEISFAPFITFAVGTSMMGFSQLVVSNGRLREAQAEIARLAVSEERARLARDLHDSLGHSLTVVAVKSELARKLVGRDPGRAQTEIADIERLARDGLTDLRASVAGYRDADLAAELSNARTALAAAGIRARLPHGVDAVAPQQRALFGWVVREGVTNVIRHSGASECWIMLTATTVTVRDNGRGSKAIGTGNGLRGLRERADAAGARLSSGTRPGGGFELEVSA